MAVESEGECECEVRASISTWPIITCLTCAVEIGMFISQVAVMGNFPH